MNGVVTALSGALCSDVISEDDKDNLRFNGGRLVGALLLATAAGTGAYFITSASRSKKATDSAAETPSA